MLWGLLRDIGQDPTHAGVYSAVAAVVAVCPWCFLPLHLWPCPVWLQSHVETKKLKGQIPSQPKGIFTQPAKKGSLGFNKTTLSERVGYKGVATE